MISWFDALAVIYNTTTKPLRSRFIPKGQNIYFDQKRDKGMSVKDICPVLSTSYYPHSQRVLEICSFEIGLDTDMGNAYAPSYNGCCSIRKHACYMTRNHSSSSRWLF